MPGTVLTTLYTLIHYSPATLGGGHIIKGLLGDSTDMFSRNQSFSRLAYRGLYPVRGMWLMGEGQCLYYYLNPQPRGAWPAPDAKDAVVI